MIRDLFIDLILATLERSQTHVVVKLPTGETALVCGVTSTNGEIVIETTLDAREELR